MDSRESPHGAESGDLMDWSEMLAISDTEGIAASVVAFILLMLSLFAVAMNTVLFAALAIRGVWRWLRGRKVLPQMEHLHAHVMKEEPWHEK